MTKRKIRNEATMICAVAASTPDLCENYGEAKRALGASQEAYLLALGAWSKVQDHYYNNCTPAEHNADNYSRPVVDAEAEALLQSGWEPGEVLT